MLLKQEHHRWIYLGALGLIAIGLPLSKAFMSIGGIALAVNFILEGHFRSRFRRLMQQPVPTLFIAFYLLHILSIFWSSDLDRALWDLRVRLPLLLFPLVIPLSKPLEKSEFRAIVLLFTAAVIATSFLSTWEFLRIKDDPAADYRTISLFTSHIRYSLMVCIGYLFLLNLAWNAKGRPIIQWTAVLFALWLSAFIFILQSMTGIVIWFLCSYLMLFYTLAFIRQQRSKTVSLTILTLAPLMVGAYLLFQVDAFYPDHQPDVAALETHTVGGEAYIHKPEKATLENGNYIHLYIAYHELESEWNERSDIPFWGGKDHTGQPIDATLMRYLTSKGLRKDSIGVNSLTQEDILAIENGVANVRFTYGNPIDSRIYTVIWEVDRMINEKRVQGHSVTQRFVYWRTGWHILKENWLVGVGVGDAPGAFEEMCERTGSNLSEQNRLRAHNQYLSVGILLGLAGMVLFILSILAPFLLLKNANTFLYIGFSIVIFASMLNEDTLETQVGVTLYAYFSFLLLYASRSLSDSFSMTSR